MGTSFFKNATVVCFSAFLLISSTAHSDDRKRFMQKYGQKHVNIDKTIFEKRDDIDLHISKDINTSSFALTIDAIESTEIDYSEANETVNKLTDSAMLEKIDKAKKYILDDVEMNLSDYSLPADAAVREDLFTKEKRYLCISSSMPKQLIRSYLQQIESRGENIEVVLNGFIGGLKKVQKTVSFINEILKKSDNQAYRVRVQINPKIFMFYKIKSVPALICDSKMDIGLVENSKYKKRESSNSAIVVYGAADLDALVRRCKEHGKDRNAR